ncbi:MAG: hypothetical protein OXT65_07725 [Alphaproteobacteria bacterium]|nr:hypothetical protein [Alphaproteobacteria bacterium]
MSDLENDKRFKSGVDANALSKNFDAHNGDFDTPEEFIRAWLAGDKRAFANMKNMNKDILHEVLETMRPEIRDLIERAILRPDHLEELQRQLGPKAMEMDFGVRE